MNTASRFALLLGLFLSFVATDYVQAQGARWLVQETRPDGLVDVRVMESVASKKQSSLHERMIFRKLLKPSDVASLSINTLPDLDLDSLQLSNSVKVRALGFNSQELSQKMFADGAPLWVPSKAEWTEADEADYSNWISTSVDENFLAGTGLNADCADVGVLFRWVYAREHSLPIANSESGGALVGHFSSSAAWDALPTDNDWKRDERFKAALRYVFNHTFTGTISNDIYPVTVSKDYVKPGTMFMIMRKSSGHTQTLKSLDSKSDVISLWGNEPAAEAIYNTPLLIEVTNRQFFGRWRWVKQTPSATGTMQWQLEDAKSMSGFNAQQFPNAFEDDYEFLDWVNQQLGIQVEDSSRLEKMVTSFINGIRQRHVLTALSVPNCVLKKCSSTSADYNNYSTFSRDARLVNQQAQIAAIFQKLGEEDPAVQAAKQLLDSTGEVIINTGLTYAQVAEDASKLKAMSPDPTLPYAERWGVKSAGLTPTQAFYFDADAYEQLGASRLNAVEMGYFFCMRGCPPDSESTKAYDTTKMDSQLPTLASWVTSAANAKGVEVDALAKAVAQTTAYSYALYPGVLHCAHHANETSSSGTPNRLIAKALPAATPPPQPTPTPGDAGPTANETMDGECTLGDVIWGDDAFARMKKWTHSPKDSSDQRWGFAP